MPLTWSEIALLISIIATILSALVNLFTLPMIVIRVCQIRHRVEQHYQAGEKTQRLADEKEEKLRTAAEEDELMYLTDTKNLK